MELHQKLRDGVRRAYGAAAEDPRQDHPFPVGRRFAESLGYPREQLTELPAASVEAFSGVSNVSIRAEIHAGSVVLDLGCGAGLDSFIAARKTGPRGRVIGVDFSRRMLDRARRAAAHSKSENVEFLEGDAEELPLRADSVDVALVNGIFNLNPDREAIFRELARVVRREGVVYAVELVLRAPLPKPVVQDEASWFA